MDLEGFEPIRRKVRLGVRSIQNLNLRLNLAERRQELTMGEPAHQVNTDTRNNADTISVEHSVLDNLPVLALNYLSTLPRFLEAGAPGGASISLIEDGRERGNVGVTASAIQAIRINSNPYTVSPPLCGVGCARYQELRWKQRAVSDH